MNIKTATVAFLKADPGLSALIGTRIYPTTLPQNVTLPAMSYLMVSNIRTKSQSGFSNLSNPRMQFNCWGRTFGEADSVAIQLKLALGDKSQTIGGEKVTSFIENELDSYDETNAIYRVIVDVRFWHG